MLYTHVKLPRSGVLSLLLEMIVLSCYCSVSHRVFRGKPGRSEVVATIFVTQALAKFPSFKITVTQALVGLSRGADLFEKCVVVDWLFPIAAEAITHSVAAPTLRSVTVSCCWPWQSVRAQLTRFQLADLSYSRRTFLKQKRSRAHRFCFSLCTQVLGTQVL